MVLNFISSKSAIESKRKYAIKMIHDPTSSATL